MLCGDQLRERRVSMMKEQCRLIVIDGLDGSGKATQTRLLCERLCDMGYKARTLSFPDYASDSSALVKMYLGGQLGESPDDVNAYAASSFYAVDRVASYLNGWGKDMGRYDFIIADRYTTSNIIHQMAKVGPSERDGFIDWLLDFENNRLGIPAPEKVLFLDVDPDISQRLMLRRYAGDETKKDIHERDFAYLMRCRESAVYAIGRLGWTAVKCDDGKEMRSIEAINDEILAIITGDSHA